MVFSIGKKIFCSTSIVRISKIVEFVCCRCEASNPATASPLVASITLQVHFKPNEIKLSVDPESPKAGKTAVLTCESGSSNPTATIVWRRGDNVLEGMGKVIEVKAGDYGGNVTVNQLEVNVTSDHHGAVYICEAENSVLKRSVHNAITLGVNCEYTKLD